VNRALALSAEVAEIRRKHQSICNAPRILLTSAIEVGEWFNVQREKIEHGGWLPWISENFPEITVRTIQKYILLAKNKELVEAKFKNETGSFLESPSIRDALREIDSRKKDKEDKEERDSRPRKDAYDEPIEAEAATPDEGDDVAFPFDDVSTVDTRTDTKGRPSTKPAKSAIKSGKIIYLSSTLDQLNAKYVESKEKVFTITIDNTWRYTVERVTPLEGDSV